MDKTNLISPNAPIPKSEQFKQLLPIITDMQEREFSRQEIVDALKKKHDFEIALSTLGVYLNRYAITPKPPTELTPPPNISPDENQALLTLVLENQKQITSQLSELETQLKLAQTVDLTQITKDMQGSAAELKQASKTIIFATERLDTASYVSWGFYLKLSVVCFSLIVAGILSGLIFRLFAF